MPPEDNKLKIGIDPVFKGQNPTAQNGAGPVSAYNVLTNQTYTPAGNAVRNIVTPINQKPDINKSIVRTYKDDIASAIQTDHISSINIALAENEKKRQNPQPLSDSSSSEYSKAKIVIFISIAFVILGTLGIGASLLLNNSNTDTPATNQIKSGLITVEHQEELNIDTIVGGRFVSALSSKLNDTQIPVNSFYRLVITTGSTTKRLVTASEFVTLAEFNMPDTVKRTLQTEFLTGIYFIDQSLPFIIFKTSSFDNAYAGMLDWEKDMLFDFKNIFRLDPDTLKLKFTDGVILNKDVRLIRNTDGEIEFLYAILDKETIVITISNTSFKEIVNRLNKEKGLKR